MIFRTLFDRIWLFCFLSLDYFRNILKFNRFLNLWPFHRSVFIPLYCYKVVVYRSIVQEIWRRNLNDRWKVLDETKRCDPIRFYLCDLNQKLYLTQKFEDCVFVSFDIHNMSAMNHISWNKQDISPYSTLLIIRKQKFDNMVKKYDRLFKTHWNYYRFQDENEKIERDFMIDFIGLRNVSLQSKNSLPKESLIVTRYNKTKIVNVFDCTDIKES